MGGNIFFNLAGRAYNVRDPGIETYKTDRRHITEILLKVALNTISQTNKSNI
jgi:hypothetical protein